MKRAARIAVARLQRWAYLVSFGIFHGERSIDVHCGLTTAIVASGTRDPETWRVWYSSFPNPYPVLRSAMGIKP